MSQIADVAVKSVSEIINSFSSKVFEMFRTLARAFAGEVAE